MPLFNRGRIYQGREQFSDESRGRQMIYLGLTAAFALIFADSLMVKKVNHVVN